MSTVDVLVGGSRTNRLLLTTFTWLLASGLVFPVVWMALTGFKTEAAAFSSTPSLFFSPTLDQFRAVFARDFLPFVLNSSFATIVSTVFVLALAIPAAWALSIASIPRFQDSLFFFISTRMLPIVGAIVPIFIIARNLGLLDNVTTLTILYTAMNVPIAVWMLRSFFLEVPREILEAGQVDGANVPQLIWRVLLPIVAPGIAATALICVIFSWNEFFFALNLTTSTAPTVPVFLVGFISSEGLFWARMSAAASMASVPVLLAGWIAQKQLVRGLSFGAVK
jgi:sorbitol/mannitol transport system permease protein